MYNWALPRPPARQCHHLESMEASMVQFSFSVALRLWMCNKGWSLDCLPWGDALLPRGLVHTQSSLEHQTPAPEGHKAVLLGAEGLGSLLQFVMCWVQIVTQLGTKLDVRCSSREALCSSFFSIMRGKDGILRNERQPAVLEHSEYLAAERIWRLLGNCFRSYLLIMVQ